MMLRLGDMKERYGKENKVGRTRVYESKER